VSSQRQIAAWIGHKDASLTMKLYAHSQDEALKAAGAALDRVVRELTTCDIGHRRSNVSNSGDAGQSGADDGNRTRVFSLGRRFDTFTVV
jgi:hypothetical protein